ncbi:MAG: RNA 2',3'-cyclic phosphodiesterase [Actinomycetota bacterium]
MTAEPVRAFVAIRPPEPVLDAIAARTADLEIPHGRKTTRDQWHVTLQFLGKADVDAVAAGLRGIDVGPHEVQLSSVGPLPPQRRSKYLVSYLFDREGESWSRALRGAVSERLRPLGFEPDHRERAKPGTLWPHLTLARMKAAMQIQRRCELVPPFYAVGPGSIGPPWTVSAIVVYESRLRPTGAEYVARATIPLVGG